MTKYQDALLALQHRLELLIEFGTRDPVAYAQAVIVEIDALIDSKISRDEE